MKSHRNENKYLQYIFWFMISTHKKLSLFWTVLWTFLQISCIFVETKIGINCYALSSNWYQFVPHTCIRSFPFYGIVRAEDWYNKLLDIEVNRSRDTGFIHHFLRKNHWGWRGHAKHQRKQLGGIHKLRLQDLAFFDPLPPSVYIFYGINVYKKWIFLTAYFL